MHDYTGRDVAVVIPTRDRWQILARTLEALAKQTIDGFETIVVVDGEDQDPPQLGNVLVLEKPQAGAGAARNLGAKSTTRPIVLFLDDDMIPVPHLLAKHLELHNRKPELEVAVLGHVQLHPSVSGNLINRWLDWSGTQFDYGNITTEEAGFGRFYSCNVSIKRDFFLSAGGFDEDFVAYYEDTDCGWRLHQKGLRLLYQPAAVAEHLQTMTWEGLVRRFQLVARGERLMTTKHAWFEPYFARRVRSAGLRPRQSRLWPLVAERVPRRFKRMRRVAERRADTWYYQQIGPYFLDAWQGARDLEELQEYLQDRYDVERLRGHVHALQQELASIGDEDEFYRSSEAYLYDLTVFATSGTKVPYLSDLRRLVTRGARLLDWGCGIGSDGLRLLDDGYAVSFADFDNPSTRYLRWRLEHRGLTADVFDIDKDDIPGGYDTAYALDVIEHVDDPFGLLAELERRARIVMVNLLEDEADHEHVYPHRTLPIEAILERARSRGIYSYRLYHGRSHLIAYRGTAPPRPTDRLRSAVQQRFGPLVPTARGREGPQRILPR